MSPLKLYFLGPPRIEIEGQVVEPDTRKATALLVYLAVVEPRPTRDWAAAFLWPEFDERRAKAALRRTLSALRSTIGRDYLQATREHIELRAAGWWCDVVFFGEMSAAVRANHELLMPADQKLLQAAVDLYRDDFLSGFSLRDSIPFDDWQAQMTGSLRTELALGLERLVKNAFTRQNFSDGVELARRWLAIDPLHEEAHRLLMQLYSGSGQRNAALRHYRDCVRILDEELGVAPLPETTALYQAIQKGETAVLRPSQEIITPVAEPHDDPLVGREGALEEIQQLYIHVGPAGRLCTIEGEPGIGKTRLAEAFVAQGSERGAAIVRARCYEGEANLAYAPIIQALQDGLAGAAPERLTTLADYHLAEAARLLPELVADRPLPTLPALSEPGAQVRFFEGVSHLLTSLLAGRSAGILWIDDGQWLDTASQELLLYLLHRLQKWPLFILICWRPEDLPPTHPLPPLATSLHHAGLGLAITPSRFSVAEVESLLTAHQMTFSPGLPQRLFTETEGLPFFVAEYIRLLDKQASASPADVPLTLPLTVRDLLHNRLLQLSETERQILQAAAAIGHGFEGVLVQAASGRSTDETAAALESVTARGLLVEYPTLYDFSHHKLRTLVYEEMGLARRRLLHRRLADAMSNRRGAPTAAGRAEIATHYQLGGQEAEAATWFLEAAAEARQLYAHQEALHYVRSALALGAEDGWRLHADCGELNMRLGRYPEALAAYETAAAVAPQGELAGLEQQLAQVYQRLGNWSLAERLLLQAKNHVGESADPATLAHLLIDLSVVAHRQKRPQNALALAHEALELANTAANESMMALANNILGMLARRQGDFATAIKLLEKGRHLADSSGRLDIQIAARNNLALALRDAGQAAAAQIQLEEALAVAERYGDRHYEAALRSNLGDVLHHAGQQAAAQEQIRQSVTIYAEIDRDKETWHAEIWRLMEW